METTLQKAKVNILKRMLGKRVFVITNPVTEEGYCGVVNKVVDHETLNIFSERREANVSIFNIRTPNRTYNCE